MLMLERMVKVSDTYSLNDLCQMDQKDMTTLLQYYGPNEVPSFGFIKSLRNSPNTES